MKITYDPAKCQTAMDERGMHFADAALVFAGPTINLKIDAMTTASSGFRRSGFSLDVW